MLCSNVKQFINEKKICLIGNAKSVLNDMRNIDEYDVICRINFGFPQCKEKYIGSRTDILFLSSTMSITDIHKFNPKFIIWCTPRRHLMTNYIIKHALLYELKDWSRLRRILKARPTTGCMAIDFLNNHTNFKQLDIYGFDFWETPTWYTEGYCKKNHNAQAEKEYILKLTTTKNINLK